ncbi:hypothetical protein AHMF7605_05770 [Adhaeribacter arboris]|uniref:Peptidase M48 domain-containing protein n=1 Tax=Adhaeribacter arboris TaxID=2072846 RepID=A0A2T2YC97_9BACT|nr:hypothetical protein [Adhaeribacter arboris]PSR53068.1 hypothetical protein AHMF7605_05770 [Adhaeribacter arboris]
MKALNNPGYLLQLLSNFWGKVGLSSLYLLFFSPSSMGYAQNLLPETSPKYVVTRQVFDRLTYVFANSRPQPQLEIRASKSNLPKIIAQYQPGNRPVIQLSEELYDLCRGLGKDSLHALAVLLSHELAHHYEKHDWYYTFGIGKASPSTSKKDIERFESEADFYGCFYGELAGFSTGRVFPQIIDVLYQRFRLADQLQGYPSKEERKAIYRKKQTEAGQMVAIFKAGQFMYLLQEFDYAATCFDYLLNRFPSREILNNLAAAKLQQALVLYQATEPPGFTYPVELDARSRLTALHRAAPDPFKAKQLGRLLNEARRYSEKSREIDPGYLPAYINLACIYSLQGNQAAAIGVINELEPAKLTGNAYTIRAIAYYQDKQPDKARQDFELARQKQAYMALYNLNLYTKLQEPLRANLAEWIRNWFDQEESAPLPNKNKAGKAEQINGEIASVALPNPTATLKISEKPYLLLQWKTEHDKLFLGVQTSDCRYLVRYTPKNYAGKTNKGIRSGSAAAALMQQYGPPTYTYPATLGEYWLYQNQKLGFELGPNKQVVNWFIYAKSM